MHSQPPTRVSGSISRFIEDYFQLVSLYSIAEFVLFGTVDIYIPNGITIVRQARWSIMSMGKSYSHDIPMLGAIALLLRPIYGDTEGMYLFFRDLTVEFIDQRNWVIAGIAESPQVIEESRMRLSGGPRCEIIERIKGFWQGTGTREDIRRFISENPWIWLWYCTLGNCCETKIV